MLELLIYPLIKPVVMQQPARMDVKEGLEVLHSASNPILEMVCFSNCLQLEKIVAKAIMELYSYVANIPVLAWVWIYHCRWALPCFKGLKVLSQLPLSNWVWTWQSAGKVAYDSMVFIQCCPTWTPILPNGSLCLTRRDFAFEHDLVTQERQLLQK